MPVTPASNIAYGRTAGYDAGTVGDVFVDAVNGSDANNGLTATTAKATVNAGYNVVKAMSGDRTLRIMGNGVRYREYLHANLLNPFPTVPLTSLRIASYGTDLPFISGALTVTGWAQCTVADQPQVGTNYASVHKVTINTSSIEHNSYWRFLTSENGVPLKLAQVRANNTIDAFHIDAQDTLFSSVSDPTLSMTTVTSTNINTITHTSTLPNYTDAQLSRAVVSVFVFPNFTRVLRVTGASAGVLSIETNSNRPNSTADYRYNLLNIGPAIEQGGWFYRDNGDGTLTLYVWPNNAASLTGGIEIAARKHGIKLQTNDRPTIIEGLGFEMTAINDTDFYSGPLTIDTAGYVTAKQVHVERFASHLGAGITGKFMHHSTISHATVRRGQGSKGVSTSGRSADKVGVNRYYNLLVDDIGFDAINVTSQIDAAVVDILIRKSGAAGHANLFNVKLGTDKVLVLGLVAEMNPATRPYGGYGNNQDSSRTFILHSTMPPSSDGRAYVDQTAGGTLIFPTGDMKMINCWVPHDPVKSLSEAITVGKVTPQVDWKVYNTITPKLTGTGNVARRNNILTLASASTADASESLAAYGTLYADAANNDFAAVPGSLLETKPGFNVESEVLAIEALFPDVNIRRDQWGRPWNPADPGVGPFGKEWVG